MTGRPGIVMVTRGPGATNASCGIHVASQDSTPLIMFVGQVARDMKEREAFQELDYKAVFGTMAKWVVEIDRADRIPEIVSRAFHVATQGRPGPVVIALPEDMLTETAEVQDAPAFSPAVMKPGAADMEALQRRLLAARNPIVLAGGAGWSEQGVNDLVRFAENFQLPVAVSFRRQMLFPADHPNFAGDLGIGPNPKLLQRVRQADLVLLAGGRLSEMPSQSYTLLDIPGDGSRLVHVHPGAEELNKVYRTGLGILAAPHAFAAAAAALPRPNAVAWAGSAEAAHDDYLAWSDPSRVRTAGDLQMAGVMAHLRAAMPADTVYCNGAGNYATWVHRFWPFRSFAVRRRGPDPGLQQRHVRHDPHAPGTRVSGPRLGHLAAQSRLRRSCPVLWRAWRDRCQDGGFRPGAGARAAERQGLDHPLPDRPRGHHTGAEPYRDPQRLPRDIG